MDELLTDEQIAIKVIKLCIYQTTTVQDSAWCVAHKSNWTTKNLVCDKYEDLLEAARAAVALTRQQIAKSQEPVSTAETQEQPGQLAQEIDALRREIETLVIQQSLISARVTALETSHSRLQEIVRLGDEGKKNKRREKLLKKAITNLEIAREISTHSFAPKYVKWGLEYLYKWQKIASTKKYNEDLRQDLAQSARTFPIDYRLKEAISCLQNAQKSKSIDTCEHWVSAAIGWSLPILYSAETSEPSQEKETNEDD